MSKIKITSHFSSRQRVFCTVNFGYDLLQNCSRVETAFPKVHRRVNINFSIFLQTFIRCRSVDIDMNFLPFHKRVDMSVFQICRGVGCLMTTTRPSFYGSCAGRYAGYRAGFRRLLDATTGGLVKHIRWDLYDRSAQPRVSNVTDRRFQHNYSPSEA